MSVYITSSLIHHLFCVCFSLSNLPGELVTVITQLKRTVEADSRMAEAYLKILAVYGHPRPFRSKTFYQIWVSKNVCIR